MSKRIFGLLFILLAIILTLAAIAQLPTILNLLIRVFTLFKGHRDAFQVGETIGSVIYWIAHFAATFALWKYGLRRMRKPVKTAFDFEKEK